jgi:hypothetical protein
VSCIRRHGTEAHANYDASQRHARPAPRGHTEPSLDPRQHEPFNVHVKQHRKEGQDTGECANLDSLLAAAEMLEGSKAGSKAVEDEAAPGGVPDLPCSADNRGACQRYYDEAGTGAQRVPAGLMEPQWEIVVPAPEPVCNPFGDPVRQQPASHPAPPGRQRPLRDSRSNLAGHVSCADRWEIPEAWDVANSGAPELEFRQGYSHRPHDLDATETDSYGAYHEDGSIAQAGLSKTGRARDTYARSVRSSSLAPRPGFSARRTLPIKRKALGSDWEHAQGSVHQRRLSLSEDAEAMGKGGAQSLAALRHRHRQRGISPGAPFGSFRAGGPRVDGHDFEASAIARNEDREWLAWQQSLRQGSELNAHRQREQPDSQYLHSRPWPEERHSMGWDAPRGEHWQRRGNLQSRGCYQHVPMDKTISPRPREHTAPGLPPTCPSKQAPDPRSATVTAVRPLSADSTASAAQGDEVLFDAVGPTCLRRSTAGTLGMVEVSTAPATVTAVANSPRHDAGRGRAGELMIEVRLAFGNAPSFYCSDPRYPVQ